MIQYKYEVIASIPYYSYLKLELNPKPPVDFKKMYFSPEHLIPYAMYEFYNEDEDTNVNIQIDRN